MERRLANIWRMTINENKCIETALISDLNIDGRLPFDDRILSIKFGRRWLIIGAARTDTCDGVCDFLTPATFQRPTNEGTLAIFTEFSSMADPSFKVGCPGESAVELARIT